MAEPGIIREYMVVKPDASRRWHVMWGDYEDIDGEKFWIDGGYVAGFKTEEAAQARADELNATLPHKGDA